MSDDRHTISNKSSKGDAEGNVYNVYTVAERDLAFNTERLKDINNAQDAASLMSAVVSGMSSEERSSVKAKDQLAYLAEEAAARAAAITADGDIIINNDSAARAISDVNSLIDTEEDMIASSNSKLRKIRKKIRFESQKSSKVSVSKDNISGNVDIVEAVTPFAALEYEPAGVSELSVESTGNNKVKVEFIKADTTSKVNVKFPNISSDGFKAVVDEKGEVLVSKYNPITDELSAKIDKSGEFTVVTNEKDFADIKSLNANVQSAIKNLAAKGVIKGTSETEFSPEKPITRAEVAALIVRILNVDDPNADGGFVDINRAEWFFGTAGSSKREGIIAGYEDNTFRGKVVIPKVQITSVVARTLKTRLGYPDVSADILKEFSDNGSIPQWARADVAAALNSNMVIRRTDNSFEPNTEMTRGDAAVIIEKLFDKVW